MQTIVPLAFNSRVVIEEDGVIIRDTSNAVHPQNMARIIARALSGEHNASIYRMAFGNGGTTTDAALQVIYKTPNDGQPPDIATWNSRLYHETYSEICYSPPGIVNPLLGTDPGSADQNTGVRPGGGAVPDNDGSPNSVHSNELGLISEVVIQVTINGSEPLQQSAPDQAPTTTDFTFDELGLYTSGARAIAASGYQQVEVGDRISTDKCGLIPGRSYSFNITVDNGTMQTISFTCPVAGGSGPNNEILYGDLCEALNTGDASWVIAPAAPLATISITDLTGGMFPTITGSQTYGFLQFDSPSMGANSRVNLTGANTNLLLAALNPPLGASLLEPVNGSNVGVQNDPLSPALERERLLTHMIFTPVTKVAGRALVVTYTLSISVARTT